MEAVELGRRLRLNRLEMKSGKRRRTRRRRRRKKSKKKKSKKRRGEGSGEEGRTGIEGGIETR